MGLFQIHLPLTGFRFLFCFAIVSAVTSSALTFTPKDNFLIDCGSGAQTIHSDGRLFLSDQNSSKYLSSRGRDILASIPSGNVPSPIYLSTRIFNEEGTYTFTMARPGWHLIRLHFFPFKTDEFDLQNARFLVTTDNLVLFHYLGVKHNNTDTNQWFFKEYLVNITVERLAIKFTPLKGGPAYINAIEVVSAPKNLITDSVSILFPVTQIYGLSTQSFQTVYRLNVGGPEIPPINDTLGRTWATDENFLAQKEFGKQVSVPATKIKYFRDGSPLIAPQSVYASAIEMSNANLAAAKFVMWNLPIDVSYQHLVRFHFCDIISFSLGDLYFEVFIDGKKAGPGIDLSSLTGGLATAYYKDFVVNSSMISSSPLSIEIRPWTKGKVATNALLNGLEVFKLNNSMGSFDGYFGVDGNTDSGVSYGTVAAIVIAMTFLVFAVVGIVAFMKRTSLMGFLKSRFSSSTTGVELIKTRVDGIFSFEEMTEATDGWDEGKMMGVGGFGRVYKGELQGMIVAIKRGKQDSQQGFTEFRTEIKMLSELRHRHLVSLIGFCDEDNEMILVYEYISRGQLCNHLYGGKEDPLTWRQRLEVCIGAASGLNYLHTGAPGQVIVHRDVKTANILLDDKFTAKIADFGLSKYLPSHSQNNQKAQNHVSTNVKGTYGYLDPEYFDRQQLTRKSDVYSFGVVLLEALCGRKAFDTDLPVEKQTLAKWAMEKKMNESLDEIIDPVLEGTFNQESMKKFADLAEICTAERGVDRPTMANVQSQLECALWLQVEAEKQSRKLAQALRRARVKVQAVNFLRGNRYLRLEKPPMADE